MSDCGAAMTPLLDLLDDIPDDARLIYEHSPTHSQSIPVGRLAREAAARVRALEADREMDEQTIKRLMDERDALQAGGCTRGQRTTQWCAEASDRREEAERLRAENERLRGLLREARTRVDCIDYCMDDYQERPFWDRVDAALAGGKP